MKSIRTISKKHYFKKAVIYFLTYCMLFNTSLVLALGDGDLASYSPDAFIDSTTWGNDTVLHTDNGAILNWNNFDTSDVQSVTFNQYIDGSLNPSSAVLNRVSGDATHFDGALIANGNVFIVNPAGVYFGGTSSVNVNQLVASSLNISDIDFQSEHYEFFDGDSSTGSVVNNGTITAAQGAILIGKKVQNTGTITTGSGGFVVMAAADRIYLGEPGSNIIIEMDSLTSPPEPDGTGDVINDGQITSEAGSIVLASGDLLASALKVEGGIGRIEQNGTISADATTGDGGVISLTGADEVVLSTGSQTSANAGTDGDSGLVVVHSKGRTEIQNGAQISATGGHVPINHYEDVTETSVEIVGEQVNFAGSVDASATGDKRGKVTIDAFDLTVADGSMPTTVLDNTVYEEWIEAQSAVSTDVELIAHSKTMGKITINTIADGEITGGSGDIILRTIYNTGEITFGDSSPATIRTTNGGNVYMLAGAGGITAGDIITRVPSWDKITEPGKIRLYTNNGGDITTGMLSVSGGSYDEVSVIASGYLTINGIVETLTNQVPSESVEVGQARTCLVSETGDVTINGGITVDAHGKQNTTADIHIDASENITINLGSGDQVKAAAKTSQSGPANATIAIHAGKKEEGAGIISITGGGSDAIEVDAKAGGGSDSVELSTSGDTNINPDETDNDAHGSIDIDNNRGPTDPTDPDETCDDCPTPPYIDPPIDPMVDPYYTSTHMGDPISGNALEGETGLEVYSYTQPEHGTVTMSENGDFEYIPDPGYADNETADSFTYIATDGELFSQPITVTISVWNNPPTPAEDTGYTHMGTAVIINITDLLNNDTDPDSDTVFFDSFTYTGSGTLVDNQDGTLTYTPVQGYVGDDTFTYTVTDPQIDGTPVETSVLITMENEPPTPAGDEASTHMGTAVIINISDLLSNDTDPDNDAVSFDSFSYTGSGLLVDNEDGTLTYTPVQGYVGDDTFAYTVTDPQIDGTPVEATVIISMGNNPPQVNDDSVTTNIGGTINSNVLDNDSDLDEDLLTVVLDGIAPEHGELTLNPDGTFSYTPDPGYTGSDSFAYEVTDGQLEGDTPVVLTGMVWITVNPLVAAAPLPEIVELDVSSCPALLEWTAQEVGIDGSLALIWITNTLASSRDIQPCDACANLKAAATILQDTDGAYIAALAQVINEYASAAAPPSEEQMALIADSIAGNTETDNALALAGEYLDAMAAYVGTLNSDLNLSTEESVTLAADKYIAPLAEGDNVGLAAYLAVRLTELGG